MSIPDGGFVDEARVRGWLANLARPELLADLDMRALLRAHGREAPASPLEAGAAAAQLVTDAIESLASPPGPPPLAYRVLRTCFVEGLKNRGAAARLGLSERQLTRERTRAIRLLAAQLGALPGAEAEGPPPLPAPHLARPGLERALAVALETSPRVFVEGPPGCGKTTLAAAHAATCPARVFWHRVAPGATARLPAILFELGEHVARDDRALAAYVRAALPALDVGLATRLALSALGTRPRLIVIDGAARLDRATDAFLVEIAARAPSAQVVVTGAPSRSVARVRVPALTLGETRDLLALAGLPPGHGTAAALHSWTGGNTRLVAGATCWLSASPNARGALDDALGQRGLLLQSLRSLRRAVERTAA